MLEDTDISLKVSRVCSYLKMYAKMQAFCQDSDESRHNEEAVENIAGIASTHSMAIVSRI